MLGRVLGKVQRAECMGDYFCHCVWVTVASEIICQLCVRGLGGQGVKSRYCLDMNE